MPTQARQTYEEIVRSLRDPALLEYAGRGAVQARIFPIPPGGERRIELEYTQALTAENGLVRYVYPAEHREILRLAAGERHRSASRCSSSGRSGRSIRPATPVAISRESANQVRAGYEAANVLPGYRFCPVLLAGRRARPFTCSPTAIQPTGRPGWLLPAAAGPAPGRSHRQTHAQRCDAGAGPFGQHGRREIPAGAGSPALYPEAISTRKTAST